MKVRVHGFNWLVYAEQVMPAFTRWLVDDDKQEVHLLYQQTRCARDEEFVPEAARKLCTWPRALEFVHQLPRGMQARREYRKLCAAELFTAMNDNYMHLYPPRLYQMSDALRVVWGAIVEQYCLPWLFRPAADPVAQLVGPAHSSEQQSALPDKSTAELEMEQEELISVLHSAGLDELAQRVHLLTQKGTQQGEDIQLPPLSQPPEHEQHSTELPSQELHQGELKGIATEGELEQKGILLGRHPETLHLRGWLARHSVRAMALFEFLACGRRSMPFGHRSGEPFESYIGYLMPDEVQQMAICLKNVQPPDVQSAERDYREFRDQLTDEWDEFRLIDEILPVHAEDFLLAVARAAQERSGLICTLH